LIANEHIRDINPTTKRLVERCLDADWNDDARSTATPAEAAEAASTPPDADDKPYLTISTTSFQHKGRSHR
jgi:hypothetical protein